MIRRAVGALDERLGAAPGLRKTLRYVFPDHWTFMLGEIAMYCFVILVITGIFLTFYYVPSDAHVHYQGSYLPLQGTSMTEAFASVMHISFDVPAGLLIRQTHHWAADVFLVAIVLHLLRILLTGTYRKPRELNYWVGVTMLGLAIFEGFLGYSLVDDLLSGMGLAIAYSVAMSVPFVGGPLAFLVWNGEYPGTSSFWPRLEIMHVLLVPMAIATLLAIHLVQIVRQHHTQFPSEGSERIVRGTPAWPGYALRSIGLFLVVAGVLFLLGGLIQINPIWEWGPYAPYLSTNGAQPDWYIGWLIGALRLMPPLEIHIGSYTVVPSPFWGGALFPLVVFGLLYAWPLLARRLVDDRRRHNLLDRPRDNPRRTALVLAFLSWVFVMFAAGATDRLYFRSFIPYEGQVWLFRGLAVAAPVVVYLVSKRVCEELRAREGDRPLRGWSGRVIRRQGEMGFEECASAAPARARPGSLGAMATADLTVIALGRPDASASEYVAAIQRRLAEQDRVRYRMHAMGTSLEGSTADILALVGKLHAVPFERGVPRVYTVLKLDERRDRPDQTLDDKVESVERRLREER